MVPDRSSLPHWLDMGWKSLGIAQIQSLAANLGVGHLPSRAHFILETPHRCADNPSVTEPFFAANSQNLAAIETALTALTSMRRDFEDRGSASEHWFYDLTCAAVFQNYTLHYLISLLDGEKPAWRTRLESRLLATHTLSVIDDLGRLVNKTFEKHLAEITNNPRIIQPLEQAAKDLAAFRRVNDKSVRALRKALGLHDESKPRERIAFDNDLDPQAIIGLAMGTIGWLSSFGKGATLLIGVIRTEKQLGDQPRDGGGP